MKPIEECGFCGHRIATFTDRRDQLREMLRRWDVFINDAPLAEQVDAVMADRIRLWLSELQVRDAIANNLDTASAENDTQRLDRLEKYLSNPHNVLAGPTATSSDWELGHLEDYFVVEGGGATLRDAIDSLDQRLNKK